MENTKSIDSFKTQEVDGESVKGGNVFGKGEPETAGNWFCGPDGTAIWGSGADAPQYMYMGSRYDSSVSGMCAPVPTMADPGPIKL